MKLSDIVERHGLVRKKKEEYDDKTTAPGPKMLIAGDMNAGFFGEVPASELIDGETLSILAGFSTGTALNNDSPWFKFALDGKILFKSKFTLRRSAFNGGKLNRLPTNVKLEINGINYNLRNLNRMKPGFTSPGNNTPKDSDFWGSEWERLMLPIHENSKTGSWDWGTRYISTNPIPNWASYSNDDLQYYGGSRKTIAIQGGEYMERGLYDEFRYPFMVGDGSSIRGIEYAKWTTSSYFHAFGWQPVLEVVE